MKDGEANSWVRKGMALRVDRKYSEAIECYCKGTYLNIRKMHRYF